MGGDRIHGHKLNTDSVGGYRLRWGLGSQTKIRVGITSFMERGQIQGHKLNADSVGGYRLR